MIVDILINSIDNIFYGLCIGVIIGTLFGISRRLLMIWSVLSDIERNTRDPENSLDYVKIMKQIKKEKDKGYF